MAGLEGRKGSAGAAGRRYRHCSHYAVATQRGGIADFAGFDRRIEGSEHVGHELDFAGRKNAGHAGQIRMNFHHQIVTGRAFSLLVSLAILLPGMAAGQPLDGYANYDAYSTAVKELSKSNLVTVSSLGKSLGERELYLLRVTRPKDDKAKDEEKPAILILGSVYAPQLLGSELAMRMVGQLVAKSNDEPIKQLLDRFVLYVIPRPNPDATETMFSKPFAERALNTRSTDDDRDFAFDEDPNEDLNGDGWITAMRVEDPTGKWMPHPADNRVLIEADAKKNETGRYLLYSEGRDNDHDERWNEDGPGGVDFNRNFTFRYAFFTPGAGPHQISEAESRAIADFVFEHTNIALVFSFSPQDNLLEPWKPGKDDDRIKTAVQTSDADQLNFLAEQYRSIHGGKDWPSPMKGEGDFAEWAYFHIGRWSLSARAWWIPKVEAEKKDGAKEEKPAEEKRGAEDVNALRWFASKGIDGFVAWTPVEHPDFPGKKVEVGGFKPLLRLNPPAAELDGLADKHLQFIGKAGGLMPALQLDVQKVESLGGGLFRVTARVLNTGYLPTVSAMGQISRLPNPVQLKITLPDGAKLVTSSERVKIEPLAGNGGSKEHVWLVNAAGAKTSAATIRAWSPSVGSVEKGVELK